MSFLLGCLGCKQSRVMPLEPPAPSAAVTPSVPYVPIPSTTCSLADYPFIEALTNLENSPLEGLTHLIVDYCMTDISIMGHYGDWKRLLPNAWKRELLPQFIQTTLSAEQQEEIGIEYPIIPDQILREIKKVELILGTKLLVIFRPRGLKSIPHMNQLGLFNNIPHLQTLASIKKKEMTNRLATREIGSLPICQQTKEVSISGHLIVVTDGILKDHVNRAIKGNIKKIGTSEELEKIYQILEKDIPPALLDNHWKPIKEITFDKADALKRVIEQSRGEVPEPLLQSNTRVLIRLSKTSEEIHYRALTRCDSSTRPTVGLIVRKVWTLRETIQSVPHEDGRIAHYMFSKWLDTNGRSVDVPMRHWISNVPRRDVKKDSD